MSVLLGGVLGFLAACILGALMWFRAEPGNDRPLSVEEIRQRVGETWEEAA